MSVPDAVIMAGSGHTGFWVIINLSMAETLFPKVERMTLTRFLKGWEKSRV